MTKHTIIYDDETGELTCPEMEEVAQGGIVREGDLYTRPPHTGGLQRRTIGVASTDFATTAPLTWRRSAMCAAKNPPAKASQGYGCACMASKTPGEVIELIDGLRLLSNDEEHAHGLEELRTTAGEKKKATKEAIAAQQAAEADLRVAENLRWARGEQLYWYLDTYEDQPILDDQGAWTGNIGSFKIGRSGGPAVEVWAWRESARGFTFDLTPNNFPVKLAFTEERKAWGPDVFEALLDFLDGDDGALIRVAWSARA